MCLSLCVLHCVYLSLCSCVSLYYIVLTCLYLRVCGLASVIVCVIVFQRFSECVALSVE